MTNVFATPEKASVRNSLFQAAEATLRKEGWAVDRIARSGKSSVRRITKGKASKTVSIRTTQDTWIAFPRTPADDAWATLADVDLVVAASVDDRTSPQFAQVHLIPGDDMRARFDRAYAARRKAGYTLPVGRGIWLSLYERESNNPVTLVGAGAGLDHPAIAKLPLSGAGIDLRARGRESIEADAPGDEPPLTIADAKRRLAASLGVAESDIKITIST